MHAMYKLFISIIILLFTSTTKASSCFMTMENDKILSSEGECKKRYSPASTFKIPLSLMGYDSGIFTDAKNPEWPFKNGYDLFINVCKGDHNPSTWMRDSCVWYSQVLTEKLGIEKFKGYIEKFDYGNKNVSGDNGKDNGLSNSWLSSSLEISPEEQVSFLEKFVDHKLPVHNNAYEMTKNILYKEELSGGWKLYGKSGNACLLNDDKTKKLDIQHGWFVGWIEKNHRKIIFASHIVDNQKEEGFASFRAKHFAQDKLFYIINEIEK
jgi:beta-lactamase class D